MSNKKRRRKKRQQKNNQDGLLNANKVVSKKNNEYSLQDLSISQKEKEYLGFSVKTWCKMILIACFAIFFVFVVVPFILSLILAMMQKDMNTFIEKFNTTSILLTVVGTVASVASIAMTIRDNKRYKEEKKHTGKLIEDVNVLSNTLKEVGNNIETILEENHIIKLKLSSIDDKIKMSTEVKDTNRGEWQDGNQAGEVDDG